MEQAAERRNATPTPASPALPWLWLLAPVLVHAGFSWIGFSPTDDGWQQAVARRLAEGQVPHRDFIFIRPVLTPLLQVPLVWWGGGHAIWWSRLWGWLMLGGACWLWSGRVLGGTSFTLRYAGYFTALLLCGHTFPVMAWSTLDGMLLCSAAVALVARGTARSRALGFFIAGLAVLCRQNFVLFPPLLLLATGGSLRGWLAAGCWSALPLLLYAAALAALGGARDFILQVWSTSVAFMDVAVRRFAVDTWFWAGLAAGVLARFALAGRAGLSARAAGHAQQALGLAAGLAVAFCLWRDPVALHERAIGLAGLVLGLAVAAWPRLARHERLTLGAGLALAWVVAISIGYNSPALMSGVLLLLAWRWLGPATVARGPLLLVAVAVALGFTCARKQHPYRDRPADELRFDVGEVLPGGAGLRTNELTHATLADLRDITRGLQAAGQRPAVLTDCAAFWLRSATGNPLSCDWPQETELGYSRALFGRVFAELQALPPGARIVVQKFLIADYDWRLAPVPRELSYYFVQNWVRGHCAKERETPFFEIYLPPHAPRG